MDITQPERQVLIAAWDVKSRAPKRVGRDELDKVAADIFGDALADLTPAMMTLMSRGWLAFDRTTETYALAGEGLELAPKLCLEYGREAFGIWMTSSEKSAAYAEYCRRVHGMALIQFNMVDAEQLAKLLDALRLAPEHRVVDLGCGIGTLTEHVSDRTGAHVTGVDFADAAISRARQRTWTKKGRLSFQVGDLNSLDLPRASFDAALVFDTLYFVDDLDRVVGDVLALLRPGGQMGAFFTSIRKKDDGAEILEPGSSRLGKALNRHGRSFTTCDFTENERRIWEAGRKAVDELEGAFEAEGNQLLWKSRDREIRTMLDVYASGSARRYLYHVGP